jgi:type I restriction enzyme R subunit
VTKPEEIARVAIDQLLTAAGWHVQDAKAANLHAGLGVAIREFPLKDGHGSADYMLYVAHKAAGVLEAKKEGFTLSGVETQSDKYVKGLPDGLPAWRKPLPFAYESTGKETRFTNGFDPQPRSRGVFAFHKPETLAELLNYAPSPRAGEDRGAEIASEAPPGFLARMNARPELVQ